jgi:hypothetical protein
MPKYMNFHNWMSFHVSLPTSQLYIFTQGKGEEILQTQAGTVVGNTI